MEKLESCQSLDVSAVKSGALDGVEQARENYSGVNLHFGFCADVVTTLESPV